MKDVQVQLNNNCNFSVSILGDLCVPHNNSNESTTVK